MLALMVQASTADRVHAAALRLFATRGFAGTGIRQIADEAGITVASLYHYMGTKEDLLERMMHESMSQLLGPAEELAALTSDPAERIAGLVRMHARRHATYRDLCRVGDTEIRSLSRVRRSRIVALRDAYQTIWEETIADGVRAGVFSVPDAKIAAIALLEMCTGIAHWYSPSGRRTLDQICTDYVAMTLALLAGARLTTTSGRPDHDLREPPPRGGVGRPRS
jgi:AcrR family transcriptional regulator